MRRITQEIDIQNQQILDIAIKVFCEKGYDKTRMDDIAQKLGITKTPIYYHFNNKAGLFDAAYRHILDSIYEHDVAIFAKRCSVYDKFVEAFVVCAVSAYQLQAVEMGHILVHNSEELESTIQYMDEMNSRFYFFKTSALREGQKNGEVRADVDVDELFSMINACYTGVLSWIGGESRRKNYSEEEKEKIVQNMIRKMFAALRPMYFC